MEFFDWMAIPETILSFFNFSVDETVESIMRVQLQTLIITLYVTAGLYLLGHLFGGFGLYKMAKRAGDKCAWMAFLPFLNTYLSGRLAGETNVFGTKVKRMGLYAALLEFVYVAINIFTLFLSMFMMRPEWYKLTYTETAAGTFLGTELAADNMPVGLRWMPTTLNVMNIVGIVWYFVTLFAFIVLYAAFFRKYFARSPYMMAFLCSFFPVRGYVFFAVRNNKPVDYNEWLQERIRRMQQSQNLYGYPPRPQNGAPSAGEPFADTSGTDASAAGGTESGDPAGTASPGSDEPFSDF